MFEQLASYSRIVVTGPQRSGTTIASQMIAADTGYRCVDESEFGVFDVAAWRDLLGQDRVVVQCPHMLKAILDEPRSDVLVVLMRRDLAAIHASEERIRWEERYRGNSTELAVFGLTAGDSAAVKYSYWAESPKPPHFLELDYDTLREHPLYVEPQERAGFGRKQTSGPAAPDTEDSGWRQWVATCAMLGISDDQIAARSLAFGHSAEAAADELAAVRRHPYYPAGARLGYRTRKLEAILGASRIVARTGPTSTGTDRRSDLSDTDFVSGYYCRNRPVMLFGLTEQWKARRWTPEVLMSRIDGDLTLAAIVGDLPGSAELLAELSPAPPFLGADPTGSTTALWSGPPGLVTPLTCDVQNLLHVQLAGRARILLFSPDQTPLLYNESGTASSVDPEAPDLARHPAFAECRPSTIELAAGEALFVPVTWWRHVRALEAGISVTFRRFTVDNEFPALVRVTQERPG